MSNSRINNTYAITATADVNRQCNEEGAGNAGSLARRPMPQWRLAVHQADF
jgi:hypothetical protein